MAAIRGGIGHCLAVGFSVSRSRCCCCVIAAAAAATAAAATRCRATHRLQGETGANRPDSRRVGSASAPVTGEQQKYQRRARYGPLMQSTSNDDAAAGACSATALTIMWRRHPARRLMLFLATAAIAAAACADAGATVATEPVDDAEELAEPSSTVTARFPCRPLVQRRHSRG